MKTPLIERSEVTAGVDPKFIRLAREVAGSRPIICDVGSRDALEGIALTRLLGAKELHVFEPNPTAANICRKHLLDFTNGTNQPTNQPTNQRSSLTKWQCPTGQVHYCFIP
jgi:hypothetical protein